MKIVVVGDAMLDRDVEGHVDRVSPHAPVPVVDVDRECTRPGGAALAAALLARERDDEIVLVAALGGDLAGVQLRASLEAQGVVVVVVGEDGETPEKVRVLSQGQTLLRLDRGGRRPSFGTLDRDVFAGAAAVLVSDYGLGILEVPGVRAALTELCAPIVWDPHPRGSSPVSSAMLVTPNAVEARLLAPDVTRGGLAGHAERGRALVERWRVASVCITLGEHGALLTYPRGAPIVVSAPVVSNGDSCGAGDLLAGTAARALAEGAVASEAVEAGVAAASAFVAAGGTGKLAGTSLTGANNKARDADATARVEEARRLGGVVVAASGCFDILHAGHVSMLRAARGLGDCLVVLLNSDASVRRLKGSNRPINSEADRAAVVGALECVDAVAVFDEDTPIAALDLIRPDYFIKGADYALAELPEAAVISRWDGHVVLTPRVNGHSTSALVRRPQRDETSWLAEGSDSEKAREGKP